MPDRRRAPIRIAGLCGVFALVSACSSGDPPSSSSGNPASSLLQESAAPTAPSPTSGLAKGTAEAPVTGGGGAVLGGPGPPSTLSTEVGGPGILVVICSTGSSDWELSLYDPVTGAKIATRPFHDTGHYFRRRCTHADSGPSIATAFNADFTAAVGTRKDADGSVRAGSVDTKTGQFTPAPLVPIGTPGYVPPGVGFGPPPSQETSPMFSPLTGKFWFRVGGDIVSAKPGGAVVGDRVPLPGNGDLTKAPPGFTLNPVDDAPIYDASAVKPSPDGTRVVVRGSYQAWVAYSGQNSVLPLRLGQARPDLEGRLRQNPPGYKGTKEPPLLPDTKVGQKLPGTDLCEVETWVSDTQFLCAPVSVNDNVTIVDVTGTAAPVELLPPSDTSNFSFEANAAKRNMVAFLSKQRGGSGKNPSLYTIDASMPGSRPRKVIDIDLKSQFEEYFILSFR